MCCAAAGFVSDSELNNRKPEGCYVCGADPVSILAPFPLFYIDFFCRLCYSFPEAIVIASRPLTNRPTLHEMHDKEDKIVE